eukprot:4616602-Heterocapsa_arctica.AAC.1
MHPGAREGTGDALFTVTPRRKPRFTVATPCDIEVYPVEVFKKYGYASDYERDNPPKAVVRVDGGNNIEDWT